MQYRGLTDQEDLNKLSRNPLRNGPLNKNYNSLVYQYSRKRKTQVDRVALGGNDSKRQVDVICW